MTPITAPEPTPSPMLTRVAVGVSIAVHGAAVALSLGYAGAGLFDANVAEAVAVNLVTPEQVAALAPEPTTLPDQKIEPDSDKLDLRLSAIEAAPPLKRPLPQPQAAEPAAAGAASLQQPPASAPQAPRPSYTPPQPDISLRYQVDLGLKVMAVTPPPALPPASGSADFDAPAMSQADIDKPSIAAFRAHLKQCAALPAAISADDKVMIVLRARFTPEGALAAAPILIEASASAKGPALMQAAIAALQSCQPHTTLPAEKYADWRVLDMRFTPQDFKRG